MIPLIPLIAAVPSLISAVSSLFKGEQAQQVKAVAESLSQVAGDLAGGRLPPEQLAILEQSTQQARIELAKINLEEMKALLADQANARALIADESKSEDGYVRRARPTGLYVGYVVLCVNYTVIPVIQLTLGKDLKPFELPDFFWYAWISAFLGYGVLREMGKGSFPLPWGMAQTKKN